MADQAYMGNLADDPVLRYGPDGKAWVSGRIIENKKDRYDPITKTWVKNENKLVLSYKLSGALAEHFAQSAAKKGQRWVITGDLVTREFEKDGVRRSMTEIIGTDAAASVMFGTTSFTRASSGHH